MTALGLTTVRSLMVAWAVGAVVIIVGLVLLTTGSPGIGVVLFVLGAIALLMTALFMLRLRAGERGDRKPRTPR